jgi:hypothetical protein
VKIDRDRLSKNIWLIIGICVLLWGGYRSAKWAFDGIWNWTHPYNYKPTGVPSDNMAMVKGQDTLVKSQVEISAPYQILGSEWLVFNVTATTQSNYTAKYEQPGAKFDVSAIASSYRTHWSTNENRSNLLFMHPKTGESHLLLERRAWISMFNHPRPMNEYDGSGDLRTVCVYAIVFDDTDGDSLLTNEDKSSHWISDLNGRNLTMIAGTNETFGRVVEVDDVVYVCKRASADDSIDIPNRVWIFNKNTRALERIPGIDSLLPKLERILWDQ